MKKPVIVLCLTLVCLGVWFLRPRGSRQALSTARVSEASVDPKLKFGSLTCTPSNCTLSVGVRVQNVCHLGDFNIMRLDLEKASNRPNFLLSVEPLFKNESSFTGVSATVSLNEALKGFHTSFQLPRFEEPIQLGLFLCKDSKNEKHCAGKEYMDLELMMSEVGSEFTRNPNYRSPDHIYFFQYLFWESESRLATYEDLSPQAMTDELYTLRFDYMAKRNPARLNDKLKAMEKIKAISRTLKSVSLETSESEITVVLPRNIGCEKK